MLRLETVLSETIPDLLCRSILDIMCAVTQQLYWRPKTPEQDKDMIALEGDLADLIQPTIIVSPE